MYLEMIPCEYGSMERKVRKCSDGEISRDENEQGDKGKLSNLTELHYKKCSNVK